MGIYGDLGGGVPFPDSPRTQKKHVFIVGRNRNPVSSHGSAIYHVDEDDNDDTRYIFNHSQVM